MDYKESVNGETLVRFPVNKKFDDWRLRRIAAIKSELRIVDQTIFTPTVAFELSEGCSVGCWFCGFSVNRLTKVLDYSSHKNFFREIIEKCLHIFGPEQTVATIFYHGTEPYDNPDYLEFIRDYEEISKEKPFTSTSVAHDEEWVRKLIDYYGNEEDCKLRINILSIKKLQKIQKLFSPEELKNVELFMQMKESATEKASSGRNLKIHPDLRDIEEGQNPCDMKPPQGTIACVNGFVISLVKRTIQLISPCYACRKRPCGYRVFDQRSFENEVDFSAIIQNMITDNMHDIPPPDKKLSFRDDLRFKPDCCGFTLTSPNQIHHFSLNEKCRGLGEIIASGEQTYKQIYNFYVKEKRVNPLVISGTVKKLYDNGFINENLLESAFL
jgi:radical SAM family RiPP maturation amino acid epimerase